MGGWIFFPFDEKTLRNISKGEETMLVMEGLVHLMADGYGKKYY